MTRDEIIRLAVECQLVTTGQREGLYMDALEKFARLVIEATPPSVPDGWQLVPVEPTLEMLYAAFAADKEYSARMFGSMSTVISVGAYDHYVAMLAEAPKPGESDE